MDLLEHMVRLELVTHTGYPNKNRTDAKLILCLQGSMEMIQGQKKQIYVKDQLLIMNADLDYDILPEENSLAAVLELSTEYIRKLTGRSGIQFLCDSSKSPAHDYVQLRDLLQKILTVHTSQRWQDRLLEMQLMGSLFGLLLKRYTVWDEKYYCEEDSERVTFITQYIHENYNQQISLQSLSEKMHLSVPYLSKYFKANMKTGFVEYLNEVRLSYTVQSLVNTNHSMTRIAFDQGFSSLTSFNRVFKDYYNMTPTEYRKKHGRYSELNCRENQATQLSLLKKYIKTNPYQEPEAQSAYVTSKVDYSRRSEYQQNWKQMWNLGSAEELLKADIQEHILLLKEELGFTTVRIWGLFTQGMLIHLDQEGNHNFSRLDQVLDFLLDHQLIPFLDIGFHPRELYGRDRTLLYEEQKSGYENPHRYRNLIVEFIRHCRDRYGADKIKSWVFEISKDDRLYLHGGEAFFQLFEEISSSIRSCVPEVKIGGGTIYVYDHLEIFEKFVEGWMNRTIRPDFISIWIYPYDITKDGKTLKEMKISSNPDYICDKLDQVNKMINRYQAQEIPVYVTRWDMSLSCRNFLNESCYRGTYLLHNTIACMEKTPVMSCFGSTDLLCEYYDSVAPLNGSYGLISKNGIKKPAFYAYYFLNRMKGDLLGRGENYLITVDQSGIIYILAFHTCRMETEYFLEQPVNVPIQDVSTLFTEDHLKLSIQIQGLSKGEYLTKHSILNTDNGSVLEEWKKLAYKPNLDKEERQYLKDICVPRMFYERMVVTDSVLSADLCLQANEMRLIEIKPD